MRTFSVQGEGKVVAIPDIALVSYSVLTEGGKNLSELQTINTKSGNDIVAFLKQSGVDKKDIKTTSYRITPRYQRYSCTRPLLGGSEPCPPPEIVGYTIKQDTLVKIRELGGAGEIIAGIVEKGANTVTGPNFTIDEPEELKNEAREKAILNARKKARSIARAGGFRLGKPVSINESGGFSISPRFFSVESSVTDSIGISPAPSIEPGSEDIVANITITYEIR